MTISQINTAIATIEAANKKEILAFVKDNGIQPDFFGLKTNREVTRSKVAFLRDAVLEGLAQELQGAKLKAKKEAEAKKATKGKAKAKKETKAKETKEQRAERIKRERIETLKKAREIRARRLAGEDIPVAPKKPKRVYRVSKEAILAHVNQVYTAELAREGQTMEEITEKVVRLAGVDYTAKKPSADWYEVQNIRMSVVRAVRSGILVETGGTRTSDGSQDGKPLLILREIAQAEATTNAIDELVG